MDDAVLTNLLRFVLLLRQEGLGIGIGEILDACRILEELDLSRRAAVHDALQAIFAKSAPEQAVFHRVFSHFFVSLEQKQADLLERQQQLQEQAAQRRQAEEELQIGGKPMELQESLRQTYAQMSEEKRAHLRKLLENAQGNLQRNERLYGNFIRSVFTHYLLEEQMRMEDAGTNCAGLDPDAAMLFADISQFPPEQIPRATEMIARIARSLNAELSRRRRRSSHSGALDFRRTIRRGMETGGNLYHLQFRRRRKPRRSLVLLCDVSGSMLQFSEFALRFLQSVSELSESARVFLFSEEVLEVDAFALENMDTFRDFVRRTGLYGRGTNLPLALDWLCRRSPRVLTPGATLVILSDTKTINLSAAMEGLQEASRQAGKLLWMNPIPERKWKYIRSAQTISQQIPMVPASSLSELSAACRKIAGTV